MSFITSFNGVLKAVKMDDSCLKLFSYGSPACRPDMQWVAIRLKFSKLKPDVT